MITQSKKFAESTKSLSFITLFVLFAAVSPFARSADLPEIQLDIKLTQQGTPVAEALTAHRPAINGNKHRAILSAFLKSDGIEYTGATIYHGNMTFNITPVLYSETEVLVSVATSDASGQGSTSGSPLMALINLKGESYVDFGFGKETDPNALHLTIAPQVM